MEQSIIKKALESNLEVLNNSFNRNHINSPKNSFYTQKYVQLFLMLDLSNFKNKNSLYLAFSDFLSEHLNKDGLFLRKEKNVFEYLMNKAIHWNLIDKYIEMDVDNRYIYLIKKFIVDCVNGLISEEIFKRKIQNIYNLKIEKTTPEEDASMCIDYFVYLNDIKCGFQIKPISFFVGLKKGTTLHSLKKIEEAFYRYKIPIFLCYVEKNNIYFVIRDKNNEECNIITEEIFMKLLEIKLTTKIAFDICSETFNKIRTKINYIKN